MSTAQSTSGKGGALVMYLVALIIIGGAVAGFMLGGVFLMTVWFVILTFLMLGLMVLMSVS
ncbi:hypothetical protein CKO11_05785 [Rhodobacter sp. TJ_12]|uniref:hypothetical protein n=1 Tax=Rhodobacter sp. TJ_12 TaxID=2029399 RepID=UPI001CBB8A57|nr:hypothetical protein [Rhodobacter sp. TJ_12]MBZ4021968.1 hypothetical protein [Rhodobacter sp. TJ_12]